MFTWRGRAKDERARIEVDLAALTEVETDPYRAARQRERAASNHAEARHWSRVAMAIAKRTGKSVGLDVATRMQHDDAGGRGFE